MIDSTRESTIRSSVLKGPHKAELQILLECAQIRPPSEIEALLEDRASAGLDWVNILETAATHGVLPLVYRSIRNVNEGLLPADLRTRTRRTFHVWGLHVHFLMEEIGAILGLFADADIRTMLFKGPALGVCAFGDASLRKPGDIDVLVPRSQFSRARDILISRGYRPEVSPEHEEEFLKARKGITFFGDRSDVDLHWTIETERHDSYPLVLGLDTEHVWTRRIPVELGHTEAWTLCPEDHLLFLSAHGTKHSWARLYLIADLAELLRTYGETLDWTYIRGRAERFGNQRILDVSLVLAADLLGAPLPAFVEEEVYADQKNIALAGQVGGWLFDPERNGNGPNEKDQHLFRLASRQRLADKAAYVFFRTQRAFSKRLTNGAGAKGVTKADAVA